MLFAFCFLVFPDLLNQSTMMYTKQTFAPRHPYRRIYSQLCRSPEYRGEIRGGNREKKHRAAIEFSLFTEYHSRVKKERTVTESLELKYFKDKARKHDDVHFLRSNLRLVPYRLGSFTTCLSAVRFWSPCIGSWQGID